MPVQFDKIKEEFSKNKEAVYFIGKLLLTYLIFQGFYDFILSPYTKIDHWLINQIVYQAKAILGGLGYQLLDPDLSYQYHVGIAGTSGVVIGNPCDGLSLFLLFSAFILVFKGKWYIKLLFISPGILLIHLLNVLRVVGLALIVNYYPGSLDFHHSYTFTLLVYSFIFLLWLLRVKLYQKRHI